MRCQSNRLFSHSSLLSSQNLVGGDGRLLLFAMSCGNEDVVSLLVVSQPQLFGRTWRMSNLNKELGNNRWTNSLITHSSQNRTPRGIIAGRSRVRIFGMRSRLTVFRMRRTIWGTSPIYIDFLFLVLLHPSSLHTRTSFFHSSPTTITNSSWL